MRRGVSALPWDLCGLHASITAGLLKPEMELGSDCGQSSTTSGCIFHFLLVMSSPYLEMASCHLGSSAFVSGRLRVGGDLPDRSVQWYLVKANTWS